MAAPESQTQTVPAESDQLPYVGLGTPLGPRSQTLNDRPCHAHWRAEYLALGRKRGSPVSYYPDL